MASKVLTDPQAKPPPTRVIAPQPHRSDPTKQGPQEIFLSSRADIAIYGGAAYSGKALSIDTPISCTIGWTTIGDVHPGDTIFSADGSKTKVLYHSGVQLDRECFEVEFSDGSKIVADAEHLWVTTTHEERWDALKKSEFFRARRRASRPSRMVSGKRPWIAVSNATRKYDYLEPLEPGIRTTKEILDTLEFRGRSNHAVAVAEPLQMPEKQFLLDPYLLGLWLGDGTSACGQMTTADPETAQAFVVGGYRPVKQPSNPYGYGIHGLSKTLRSMSILGNKHIPSEYLRGSIYQRLALVQGLMDTDGSAGKNENEFCTTSKRLADGMEELLLSLGIKVTAKKSKATLYGRVISDRWRLHFRTGIPVFRLQRKLDKQKRACFRGGHMRRYIRSITKVPSVPVCCIAVDHPSKTFLAGRSMIPTHNTTALLLEPLRHIGNRGFTCIIFRRTYPEITNQGGLWDESFEYYPTVGGKARANTLDWSFPSGASISFAHMQHESDRLRFDGSQIALIEFDQAEHFGQRQVFYMLSRNRSQCGVKPYMRMSCNPDPNSWLREFMGWWIDEKTGYPIYERSGALRWFVMLGGNEPSWADSPEELFERHHHDKNLLPKSFTFIPGLPTDNVIGLAKDPGYLANLGILQKVDRERLEKGNWNIREEAGNYFQRAWLPVVDEKELPEKWEKVIRYWDRAGTDAKKAKAGTSYTVGLKLGRSKGIYYVLDVIRFRGTPMNVEDAIKGAAEMDGQDCLIGIEQDPGQAGLAEAEHQIKMLSGWNAFRNPVRESKGLRAKPVSAAAEHGHVRILRATWNELFWRETENYDGTDEGITDQVDSLSGAYHSIRKRGRAGVW